MPTSADRISADPASTKPNLVTLPRVATDRRSKWFKWVIALALGLLLAAAGLAWRAHLQNAITYEVVSVEQGPIQAGVTATGNLNAVVDVLVSSQVSGNIKALYADWNTKVKKDQLIALIDPQIFQAQVDQATASFRSAHSASITAQAQIEKSKADLSGAIASEKNAEAIEAKDAANQANAKAQWERAETLLQNQIMAQQDYDSAKAAYDASQAQVTADGAQIDAAQHAIASAKAEVQVAQNELGSAQAQEHQQQAALQQAQINLDHCQIYAPVDGTIIARRMDVGQTVASSLNPPTIFEIAQDLTKMQVDTNVDQSDVGNIVIGQKAAFTVDSYPDTLFQGVVADLRKAPIVTQNVVTYDVVLTVDNSSLKLFPGMTANVTVQTMRVADTLKVPNSAVRFHPSVAVLKQTGLPPVQADKQQVYVLAGGKLTGVPVKFGLSDGRFTAVTSSSLHAGDKVAIRAGIGTGTSGTSPATTMPGAPRM